MKIAILTDTYSPEINGIVTSILNFTENLARDGHEILIIAPKYNRKHDPKIENIIIKRYPSFSFASNKETRVAYPSIVGIIGDLRKFKPDIIHIQTPMSIGVVGVMAAKILGIKSIQTYHTYIPDFMVYLSPYNLLGFDRAASSLASSKVVRKIIESESYKLLDETAVNIQKKSEVIRILNKLVKRLRRKRSQKFSDRFAWDFTRFLYGKSDIVLTPSIALSKLLTRHGMKVPVYDLSNGIEYNQIEKKVDYRIRNRMVHVGRLGLEKGIDVVIKAFATALKTNPNLTLDICGDGPAMSKLIKLSESLGIEKNVNFLGFVPRNKVKKLLKRYDFFVTASTIETQGLVVLEAMAAGLPVLGVDALAVPELVINNKNGYLTKPGDTKGMAVAMLKLVTDSGRNKKFGQFSLEIAETHDLTHCAEKLENIYSELICS